MTADAQPLFDYEITPCIMEDGCYVGCDDSEADSWGVYERPREPDEHNNRLATWIADFARKEDAIFFKDTLAGKHIDSVQQLRDTGHFVVVWSPEELGDADTNALEELIIGYGNEMIECLQRPTYLENKP